MILYLIREEHCDCQMVVSSVENVIIIGVDNRSQVNGYNRITEILVLGESPSNGIDDATLHANAEHAINSKQNGLN